MDILRALTFNVPKEYGFSALVCALMMVIFYRIVTHQRLIQVADRVLNRSLQATHLYRFIKLAIVLVFVFSLAVMALSFLTPVLMRHTENRSLELVLQGKAKFEAKQYDKARPLLEGSLSLMSPDEPSADEIRGLITATYYTADQHEQGLNFICEQYRHKPAADRSFLFPVHAHLRKFAVIHTTGKAEALALHLRKKCNRADFSPFWAHIPFGMMESLRTGRLRTEHSWELSEVSTQRLQLLVQREQEATLSREVPLGDYALYFLGQFDALLDNYPDSPIRDMALFDAAMFSQEAQRIQYLTRLVEQHPNSRRYADAVKGLASGLAKLGKRDLALTYVARLKSLDALDNATQAAIAPTLTSYREFIKTADFVAGEALLTQACKDFMQENLPCATVLQQEHKKTTQAIKFARTKLSSLRCTKSQAQLRTLSQLDDKSIDGNWLAATRSYLVGCLDRVAATDPEDYARSLYLLASLSRKLGDYKASLDYLQRFQREIPSHHLLDDVLTEIGYHKLVLEGDWSAALPYFSEVIESHQNANAYDNALWWYARGSAREGAYGDAVAAYARISALDIQSRFKKWSGSEQRSLERLMAHLPFTGVVLQPNKEGGGGLVVASVAATSSVGKFLKPGDHLMRLCDKPTRNIDGVLGILSEMDQASPCEVGYLRGDIYLRFFPMENGQWRVRSAQLNENQLRKLIFGS